MTAAAPQRRIEEVLQQFMDGDDIATEFTFLDSLFTDQTVCRNRFYKEWQGGNTSASPQVDNHAVDVSVCDVIFTLNNTETSDKSRLSLGGELDVCNGSEQDIGCKDLLFEKDGKMGSDLQYISSSPINDIHHENGITDMIYHENHTHLSDGSEENVSELAENLCSWLLNTGQDYLYDAVLVEKFAEYVFVRRYGPADKHCDDGSALDMQSDPHVIGDLNKRLDTVMKRMMELPVTAELTSGYSAVLQRASGMPTLRKKLLEHVMLWLSRQKATLDETIFKHVKSVVLTGLSDVWSVVRKTCSAGVSRVFRDWSLTQQEDIFKCFLEICIDKEGSWQSKDGSALCVHAIVYNCFTPSIHKKEGAIELPNYIVECVLTIVFSLISHPQLSIRETVTKIMSAYMEHVDYQDMMDLMQQTLTLLTPPVAETQMHESFNCVEAYAGEGLLNICASIVKVLPMRKAVQVWLTHYKPFLTYLSHDASSVRQTTSTLIMHVATNRESSAVLMKLVMHHLTRSWPVSVQTLATCHHFLQNIAEDELPWELKEGRLFVYELLCKHLIESHSAIVDGEPNAVALQIACSEDGGSEVEESLEHVYKNVGSYLTRQSPLKQLFLLDNATLLADEAGIQMLSEKELQDLQCWLLVHYPCLSCSYDDAYTGNDDLLLPTCQELFMLMFHHTAVCLAHPQWELRRIAQQVLPYLCEVMCLYNVDFIMSVWHYITEETSLLSFLGLYALHQSLALCARVVATADLTSKESAISNPIYVGFVDGVRKHVENYLSPVCHHLLREAYDRVSVVAAETALLSLNFFDLHHQIQEELCSGVVTLWKNLFIFAHPKSAISTSLFPAPKHQFHSPYEGFLSCCLVPPESNVQCAKQVEKSLMLTIHKHLPHFLPQLDSPLAAFCLPLLAHNIGLFIDDSDVCKSLINSFHTLCQCTKKSFDSMASDVSSGNVHDRDMSLKCVYFTIRELTAVIALKSLEVALLQKILNCYLVVCESLQPETHIPLLLQGVSARLSDSKFYVDTVEGGKLDVTLSWNRPELPPGFGQNHSVMQDEDSLDRSYAEENESDTSLNRSSSSLGLQLYSRTGRRRTLSTTDDILEIREIAARLSPKSKGETGKEEEDKEEEVEEEEEDEESDWDSWSEEEPDGEQSILQTHFRDFFQRLGDIYGAAGKKILHDGIAHLGAKEKGLLRDLLT